MSRKEISSIKKDSLKERTLHESHQVDVNRRLFNTIQDQLQTLVYVQNQDILSQHESFYKKIGGVISEEVHASCVPIPEEDTDTYCARIAQSLDSLRKTWMVAYALIAPLDGYRLISDERFFDRWLVKYAQYVSGSETEISPLLKIWATGSVFKDVREGADWLTNPGLIPVNEIPEVESQRNPS